ncbi:MAG: DUF1127 domain-containing protein [Parvibaculaceae bacterium]
MGTIVTIKRPAYSTHSVGKASRLVHWLRTFERMLERRRTRVALLELTDEQLKDIGLSRSQVHKEVSRPFWD